MSFIFYDIETTGKVKGFDQILQFGAIRTDTDLKEIERFEVRSRLLPHIVPAPGALHITGQSISDITDQARPSHYQMVCEIQRALSGWCPSMFLGYNSLKFDEEFLRQAFYQCLHPPYLTNTQGSTRGDVLNLMRLMARLHPSTLSVPNDESGRPSFKLDRLAPANGFAHLNAHDAMADVEATIFLCKLVRDQASDLWSRFIQFSQKAAVLNFIIDEDAFGYFEIAGNWFGANVVTRIGSNSSQANINYCFDLKQEFSELSTLSDEKLRVRVAQSPKIVRRLKANGAPLLCPLYEAPADLMNGVSEEEFVRRAKALREDQELCQRIVAACEVNEKTYDPSPHVEQQLYEGGFWGDADGALMARFHTVPWEERLDISIQFEDRRLKRVARRLIYFERPDLLPEAERQAMKDEISRRMLGTSSQSGPWMTVPGALAELDELLSASGGGSLLLATYRDYLVALSA